MNAGIPVLAVVGPTASGKTSLAVSLAKALDGEVVSADSMQVYRQMQIATAKPTPEEQQGIPHHLIDFLEPDAPFSVADYVALAKPILADIHVRGKLPILCGGTGLFVDTLLQNIQLGEAGNDPDLRAELRKKAETMGAEALLSELREFDPESANALHPNNLGRIIRAIEYYRLTGETITQQKERSRREPSPFDVFYLGITYRDRERLYDRIGRRVDLMLEQGLLSETKWFVETAGLRQSAQAIGYKELAPYLRGDCTLEEAVENLKRETRRYAKRQLTWFRRNPEMHWLYADELPEAERLEAALKLINQEAFLK